MFAVAADLFTLARLIAAALLVWLGLQGPETLECAILVGVLGWTTDQLDGWAARHARSPTHLAPYDFAIDSVLYAATLAYLGLANFVPRPQVLAFAGLTLAAGLIFRRKAIVILCFRLIDLATIVVIFSHLPVTGYVLCAWLGALALLYRRRVVQRVPCWLAELAHLLHLGSL